MHRDDVRTHKLDTHRNEVWAYKLEKLFVWFLFANPVIDILSGMFMFFSRHLGINVYSWQYPITPSLAIRMVFLLVMCAYLLLKRDWKSILPLVLIGIGSIMSIISAIFWVKTGYNTFTDMQYIARFIYNIAALFVYTRSLTMSGRNKRHDVMELLRKFFTWSAIVISASIILCLIATTLATTIAGFTIRIGYTSYADRFGLRGTSGFYTAANEAAAVLLLLLPLVIYDFLQVTNYRDTKNWPRLAAPALTVNAMLIIGTKTSLLGVLLTILAITAFYIWHNLRLKNRENFLKPFAILLAGIVLFFLLLLPLGMIGGLAGSFSALPDIATEERSAEDFDYLNNPEQQKMLAESHWLVKLIFSGRQYYLMKTGGAWTNGGFFTWIFGVGRSSQNHIVEMDLFEVLFYYGIFGFIVMLLPYLRSAKKLLKDFFHNKPHLLSFCIVFALALTLFYSITAGHVLFSVTGCFYFVMLVVYSDFFYRPESVHPKMKAKKAKR
jgi:hypothetical protein